ncbi:hemolysin-III related-domain-containing protein [Lipomyces kononenkoae]|uniref:Hemolysin-III related-domain-containing protein n=1 Tax=Lipomyces kononenkoae TaxID=34357 RepID=A0ACC3SVR6_LIPKO
MVTAASAFTTTTTSAGTATAPSTGVSSSTSMSSSGMSSGHRRSSSVSAQAAVAVMTSMAGRDSSATKASLVQYSYLEVEATDDHDSLKNVPSDAADVCSTFSLSRTSAAHQLLTVIWDDLPAWRRDNHYIRSGYRKETFSFWQCFQSLTYLHNESVNIYSHLIGSLFFLLFLAVTLDLFLPRYPTTSAQDFVVIVIFFLGAVICLGMSSTYHCINCHSESVAKFGNQLDYIGIIFLIVGSFVPAIYYGLYTMPHYMSIFFGLTCGLGAICAFLTLQKKFASPTWRPFRALMFVIFGLSGIIPITFGGVVLGYYELYHRIQLAYLISEGVLYIGGAAIYALRIPERWIPGRFDIFGSSHQIFHFCVLAAAVCHLKGTINSYNYCHGERQGL